jgi:hypothetical protein
MVRLQFDTCQMLVTQARDECRYRVHIERGDVVGQLRVVHEDVRIVPSLGILPEQAHKAANKRVSAKLEPRCDCRWRGARRWSARTAEEKSDERAAELFHTLSNSSKRPEVTRSMTSPAIASPFSIAVDDVTLADLRSRILKTRWPNAVPGIEWDQGTNLPCSLPNATLQQTRSEILVRSGMTSRFARGVLVPDGRPRQVTAVSRATCDIIL